MRPSDLQVGHRYATINGAHFHFVEAGTGPLVLLLHGFPEMWWSWRHQIQPLVDAGFRVVVPDLRGYNDSEKVGPYDLATLMEDVHGLIEYAGEKQAILVGHDWGGAIAWNFAAHYPEYCAKLSVLNCPHPALFMRALRGNLAQLRRSWYMLAFQLPRLPEAALTALRGRLLRQMFRRMAVDPTHFGDEEIEPMVDAMLKPGAAKAAVDYYRAMARSWADLSRGRQSAKLPRIQCPTLLVWGKKDAAFDYEAVVPGTQKHVPKLRTETIEQCGHFVHEEQPERVNELLLGFLKSGVET